MKYESLIQDFLKEFPEIRNIATEKSNSWDSEIPLIHVFFGYVLNPFINQELISLENPILLDRIFQFLEKMAISDDESVHEVLALTILQWIGQDSTRLKNARKMMRPNTLKLSYDIEKA